MPTLEITTTLSCPLDCTVCPQSVLKSAYKSSINKLTYENFVKILNKVPNYVRIDFSGMSEPWINRECTKMLKYTLESNYRVAIYTTLVGMLPHEVDEIVQLIYKYEDKISNFCIHLPDINDNLKGWKKTSNYDYAVNKLININDLTKTKIKFEMMTMDNDNKLHVDIQHLNISLTSWTGHRRADSLPLNETNKKYVINEVRHDLPVSCLSTPYYDHNVLLPNGDVILCCMDYGLKNIIGNLLTDTYEDLYLNDTMIKLMKENKKFGWSKCSICKSCTNAKSHYINNLSHWTT